jgi:protocatechuate 3,4-dioxygenase beta subunit
LQRLWKEDDVTSDRDMARDGLTRRALILAAPSLLVPGAGLAALAPTPGSSEGPFYPVRIPDDEDADLVRVEGAVREAGGDILYLAGRVLDANARPVAGTRIEIWQCDANGVYLHPGDPRQASRDTGFQGFGHARADATGQFAFRTIVPVPYPGRTPHIHVKVLIENRDLLTTQLYRAGYPQNPSDFLFRRLAPDEQGRVSMVITPRVASPQPAFETEIDLVIGG